MTETVTIWVPTATGVRRVEGCTPWVSGGFDKQNPFACFYPHEEGRKWCRTEAQARGIAEQMRLKRIASLKKQLAKLEKSGPHNASAEEAPAAVGHPAHVRKDA